MSDSEDPVSSERWQRLTDIFSAVLPLNSERRLELLKQLCGDDEHLRDEIEALLASTQHAGEEGFLDGDLFRDGVRLLSDNEVSSGTQIGPFRIVREIGRGGMGVVYLAEREGFPRQVALKILKRGMDTDAIIRRFVMERDVLASLNHPNIARLLDGGTTPDGLPFIAMEYVEGESITDFSDRNRLTIEQRLRLFRKVCAPVAYAHQNLVVHRDIKPSNILVSADGEPKLLDFGIAKLLSPDHVGITLERTVTGANLMTPEYASPEQIRGEKITTASDIYSLGVLLYELLCGRRPFSFKNRSVNDVLQIISERLPVAPSTAALTKDERPQIEIGEQRVVRPDTIAEMRSEKPGRLQRKLMGDLDNIVLMALRKEPLRRYESAQEFAEDIKRHLEGLPVLARPATLSYRTAKFIERNRAASAFAAIALIAILSGLSIAVWQAVVAKHERDRAERRSHEVQRLTETLLKDLQVEVDALQGSGRAKEKLSKVSIEYLTGLSQEMNDPVVLRQLAEAHVFLGKQYGYEMRKPDEVRANIRQGLEIARSLVAIASDDLESKKLLAKNLEEYDYFCEKDPEQKLNLNRERAKLREEIAAATPNEPEAFFEVAGAYGTLGYLSRAYQKPADATEYNQRALDARKRQIELLEQMSRTSRQSDQLALAYSVLGWTFANDASDFKTAESYYSRAVTIAEELVAAAPDYRLGWTRLVSANSGIAGLRYRQNDYQGALNYFQACLRTVREGNRKVPDVQLQVAEANYMLRVAENLFRTGKTNEGLPLVRDAIVINTRLTNFNRDSVQSLMSKASFLRWAADAYVVGKRVDEALDLLRQSELLWKKTATVDTSLESATKGSVASIWIARGAIYTENRGRRREARVEYERAIDVLSKLKTENQITEDQLKDLARAREQLRALLG